MGVVNFLPFSPSQRISDIILHVFFPLLSPRLLRRGYQGSGSHEISAAIPFTNVHP